VSLATFQYVAVDDEGRKVDGRLDAPGRPAALEQLRRQGLTPVRVEPSTAPATGLVGRGGRFTRRKAEAFCRELGHLLAAGISMSRAMGLLRRQATGRSAEVVAEIHDAVTGGSTLAEAMSRHPGAFTRVQVAMVQAGEAGGFLDVVLAQIADFQARQRDLASRVRSALAYPLVLVAVAASVLVFLLHYFIPKFSRMFTDLGGTLPPLTRAVVAVSDVVSRYGAIALVAGLVIALLARRMLQGPGARLAWQRAVLGMPVVGSIVARWALVRFCRMLGTLIGAGVGLVASLRVAREALGNEVLSDAVGRAIDDVVKGRSLSGSLRSCDRLFPLSVIEMLAVAEEASRLDDELRRLADVNEKELDRRLHLAVSLAEPIVLFVMAGLVGTVVIAMLLPIFSLQELIK
jgi:type II secretory pathway component PulF